MRKKVNVSAPNGTAWMIIIEGEVIHLDTKNWSDTHVSSSGGGGYVGPKGGFVSAPSIHSTVTQRQQTKFWVREADGMECEFTLMDTDCGFSVVPGQKVRIAWGANISKERGDYLFAYNFSSRENWHFHMRDWHNWCCRERLAAYPSYGGGLNGCLSWLLYPLLLFVGFCSYKVYTSPPKHILEESAYSIQTMVVVFFVLTLTFVIIKELGAMLQRAKMKRKLLAQQQATEVFRQHLLLEFEKAFD